MNIRKSGSVESFVKLYLSRWNYPYQHF